MSCTAKCPWVIILAKLKLGAEQIISLLQILWSPLTLFLVLHFFFFFFFTNAHMLLCPHTSCRASHDHFGLESVTVPAKWRRQWESWKLCVCKSCSFYEFDELESELVSSLILTLPSWTKNFINMKKVRQHNC